MIRLVEQDIVDGFQWSTSEQVWPFEKDSNGATLYCKKVNLGTLPNVGQKLVNHNTPSISSMYMLYGMAIHSSGTFRKTLPYAGTAITGANVTDAIVVSCDGANINILAWVDRSAYTGYMYMIYNK